VATSSDLYGDSLRFTWSWGNGTYNVTTASGTGQLSSNVKHTWATSGNYAVQVFVDDMSLMTGHNVSADAVAVISPSGTQQPPGGLILTWVPSKIYVGTAVTFNATAYDANGDAITFDIEYGDGTTGSASSNGASMGAQYALPVFTHTYSATRTYAVNLTARDATSSSAPFSANLVVSVNVPPELNLASSASGLYNRTMALVPSLVRDADGDDLSVWYDWGDESESGGNETFIGHHVYQSIGEYTVTVWVDDGTGFFGHNVSGTIKVTINENQRPIIVGAIAKDPNKASYKPSETITFTIVVSDYENDTVNITVNFDDGSTPFKMTFKPGAHVNVTKTFNHTFTDARKASYHVVATVDDGMMQYHFVKEWYTQSADVNVPVKKSNLMLYVGLIALVAIVALLAVFFLAKRRKGPKEDAGSMEGMKPPEEPPSPPTQM